MITFYQPTLRFHWLFLITLEAICFPARGQKGPDTVSANQYYRIADSLSERGNYQEANQRFRQAQDIYQSAEMWEKYVACLNSTAFNKCLVAEYDSAIAMAQRALQLSDKRLSEGHPQAARAYDVLGTIREHQGQVEKALNNYQKSLRIKEQYHPEDHPSMAESYENIGVAYGRLGQAEPSLLYLQKVLAIRRGMYPEDHPKIADCYTNLGGAHRVEGNQDQALVCYQKALTIYQKALGEAHPKVARSYNNIGTTYEKSNEQALTYFQKALDVKKKVFGEVHPSVATSYLNIGEAYGRRGDYSQALVYHQKALSISRETIGEVNPQVASILHRIATIYKEKSEYSTALRFYQKSLIANEVSFQDTSTHANPSLNDYVYGTLMLITLTDKAETSYVLGHDSLAYATCLLTDSLLDQLRHAHHTQGGKISLGRYAEEAYKKTTRISLQLYRATSDRKYLHAAFRFSERSKASVLLDASSASEAKYSGHMPEHLITLETSLKADRSRYRSQLAQAADSSAIQNSLFVVNQRYDSLVNVLETQYPDYYQLRYATHTATMPTIQSRLLPGEALVSYFIGDSMQYAFTITREQFKVITMPLDTLLGRRIQKLRGALRPDSTTRAAYIQRASDLYQQLLAPVVKDSLLNGIDRLTIIPDKAIGYLPFDLLLTRPIASPTGYQLLPYLMRNYTIRYGYSATWLFHPFSRPEQSVQDQYIAFAPSYQRATSDSAQQLALGRFRDQVDPLRFNQQEATNIRHYLSGVSLTDQSAVERRFKEEASQYNVIHLAMHALVDDKNPMYSRLVFSSDATDTLEDGYLNAYELYNMELTADLVVLSACETGYGKLEQGEGIMSLARAFAYAGCPSIVMSHWTVDDAASAQLMDHFYRYLAKGLPKDEALRQAKLAYLNTAPVQSTHPFFWGNFVVIGDASPVVNSRSKWMYCLLGGGMLLVIGLFFFLIKRRKRELVVSP